MQNLQEVAEETVGMERCIFIEMRLFDITTIDLMLADSFQLTIAMMA